jgi:hypothetical protein
VVKKADAYRWIRVGGLLSLIPLTLAAGPLAGYLAGDWLVTRFGLPAYTTPGAIAIGMIASAVEVVRIIKAALVSART